MQEEYCPFEPPISGTHNCFMISHLTNIHFNNDRLFDRNLAKLKDGMGEKLAVVSNLLGTALICFCVAVPMGWQLALACAAVMPFSIAASVALSNVSTKKHNQI